MLLLTKLPGIEKKSSMVEQYGLVCFSFATSLSRSKKIAKLNNGYLLDKSLISLQTMLSVLLTLSSNTTY